MTDDYLECHIVDDYVDPSTESVTVYVHLHEPVHGLIVFHEVKSDPVFYRGWFSIEHEFVGMRLNSQVVASNVKYISSHVKDKELN